MIIGVSFEKVVPDYYNWYDRFKVKAVMKWTKSKYFHTEVIVGDYWISANTEGIKRYKLKKLRDSYDYIFLDIPISDSHHKKILDFIDNQIGTEYDWLGIYLSQFVKIGANREDKWFCSELVTKILQLCMVYETLELQPHLVSPEDLFQNMMNIVDKKGAAFFHGDTAEKLLNDYITSREDFQI